MPLPLAEWDEDYIRNELLTSDETGALEFKASAKFVLRSTGSPNGDTQQEIAKQVSAFANSRAGVLVFGVTDGRPRQFDEGVPLYINNTPLKQWIEKVVPELLQPMVSNCEARTFRLS